MKRAYESVVNESVEIAYHLGRLRESFTNVLDFLSGKYACKVFLSTRVIFVMALGKNISKCIGPLKCTEVL